MKFCQEHWDILRENLRKEGIYDWVATSGEMAVDMLKDEIARGEHTQVNYDPLMACHTMMMDRTLEMVGLYCMTKDFGCPICFFNSYRNEDGSCKCVDPECTAKEPGAIPPFETWLEQTPKVCKEYMQEQGWI